jgi:predicted RNase H-like HicB family nuclease
MMAQAQHTVLSSYRLPLEIEQMEDGSYMATSPVLEGFLVLADSVEQVISLAPGIAKALIETMHADGVMLPLDLEEIHFPVKVEVLVV